jgi:nucleotide-binding universal stress UspA family protein
MFKKILVPIDGSIHAQAAVDYGAYFASEFRAQIELLHVIDWRLLAGHFITHFDDIFRSKLGKSFTERVKHYYKEYGERLLQNGRERATGFGVSEITTSIETGSVVKRIIERAGGADLLIIGQHGEGAELETGFIGTVVDRVLHSINITTLVVQPPLRTFRRALLAYDGSEPAHRAMKALSKLAVALKLEVDVVQMIEPDKDMNSLKDASDYLSSHPISFTTHHLEGESHLSILEHAKQKECDLLAMGAFGDKKVEVLALGTTTEAMVGHSHIPVLVHR